MDIPLNEKVRLWVSVSKKLEANEENIECPFCEAEKLTITEVNRPDLKKDVYLFCPNCEAYTVFSGVVNVSFKP